MPQTVNIPTNLVLQLRKLLHQHPELSGKEKQTAKRIAGFLKSYKPTKIIKGLGGHGVAAVYGHAKNGPTVLVRCELDALPIEETNKFAHRSEKPGVSHKCGHDGHMAMVAGLGIVLSRNRPRNGRIVLLFQPAEETGEGARSVLDDPKFAAIEPDYVVALHNLPGYPKNTIVCRTGVFSATVNSCTITLNGKTAHAGQPETGINPAQAIAELLTQAQQLQQTDDNLQLLTPIQIAMGEEAYGISAGHGLVRFTLRCWTPEAMSKLMQTLEKCAASVAQKHKLKHAVEWTQYFAANTNNARMVELVEQAASLYGLQYVQKESPFRWGEDFGLFTERYEGAMFGLGAGEDCPDLHNPDYEFPDEIIPAGVAVFHSVIDQLLS